MWPKDRTDLLDGQRDARESAADEADAIEHGSEPRQLRGRMT